MEIRPPKPSGKVDTIFDKKKPEALKPPTGIFSQLLVGQMSPAEDLDKVTEEKDTELDDLVELHQQFVASVNHEINNPLLVVRGMAELLSNDDYAPVKMRISQDTNEIVEKIKEFNNRDIYAVGQECRQAPLSEIAFRKDLVSCYLAKVIGKFTASLSRTLDDIEDALKIENKLNPYQTSEYDKVKRFMHAIRVHAERIRKIIEKLQNLLPQDIEITQYVEELKMVNLRKEDK
jgi:signal transduction histidine kinase